MTKTLKSICWNCLKGVSSANSFVWLANEYNIFQEISSWQAEIQSVNITQVQVFIFQGLFSLKVKENRNFLLRKSVISIDFLTTAALWIIAVAVAIKVIIKGMRLDEKLYESPLNPLTTSVPHHIETSQLICSANQSTGFYMMGNNIRQWVKMTYHLVNSQHDFYGSFRRIFQNCRVYMDNVFLILLCNFIMLRSCNYVDPFSTSMANLR